MVENMNVCFVHKIRKNSSFSGEGVLVLATATSLSIAFEWVEKHKDQSKIVTFFFKAVISNSFTEI
jgi:F0F1-type ATP synthase assembly protein I